MPPLARSVESDPNKPAVLYQKLKMSGGTTEEEQRINVPSNKKQIHNLQMNYR